jgi:hypothetical protein
MLAALLVAAGLGVRPAEAAAGELSFAGIADWDNDGSQDVLATESGTGLLWLYPGEATRRVSPDPRVQIGSGMDGLTVAGVTDWDDDGNQDLIAKENSTGLLWLYPGNSTRGPSPVQRVEIGNGWGSRTIVGLADWDNDGKQDVLARDGVSGVLWLYPGRSVRGHGWDERVQLGTGWNGYTVAGIADWDNDGYVDLIARQDSSGILWLYPGHSLRAPSPEARVRIGADWRGSTFAGVADWDNDGHQDVVARNDATGVLWLSPGRSTRNQDFDAKVQVGHDR